MKNTFKKITAILYFIFATIQLFGQNYTETINHIFQQVDKSKISTGILADYGVQVIDLGAFNGIPADSNYVAMDTWKMLYGGLYSSKINGNATLFSTDTVINRISNQIDGASVSLAMMQFKYNKLNDNAVALGLLQIVNGQIIEINGAASPYLDKQLFAVAPKSTLFNSRTASFVFKSSLWFSNSGKTVQKLEINFNNESGYITANWDTPTSYTFSSDSTKTIYFRLTYTDGSSYISQTNIMMNGSSIQKAPGLREIKSIIIPPSSEHSGGTIQILYSSSNTLRILKKPLIVAEGYDASGVMPDTQNNDIFNFIGSNYFGTINIPYSSGSLLDYINTNQFDIVYVDNNNGVDDIRRNAKLFEQAIDWVNTNKDSTQPNVVMGISMGGLVARYALRKMEMEGKDHQTWKYISVDAPHKGANVPVGIQAAVRHIENIDFNIYWFITVGNISDFNANLKGAINLLNSKATKQLLMYQVTKDFTYDNSEYTSFMSEYESMGFPQKCQNIAITDGSGNDTKIFGPGTQLLNINESFSLNWWMEILSYSVGVISTFTNYPQFAINLIPGNSQVCATISSNALPDKSISTVYNGRIFIKKKILWLIPVQIDITNKTLKSTSEMLPVDGAPGGLYNVSVFGLSSDFSKYVLQPSFCFVPTVSALALTNWKDKLTSTLQNTDFYANGTSDFDLYFMPTINEFHTRFNSSAPFLYSHLTAPAFSYKSNQYLFCGANTISINNTFNSPISWSVSPGFSLGTLNNTSSVVNSISTNQSGLLTASSNGFPVRKRIASICNLSISGPSHACPGENMDFTIINPPAGATIVWSQDPYVTRVSPQGSNPCTFTCADNYTVSISANVVIGSVSTNLTKVVDMGRGYYEYKDFLLQVWSSTGQLINMEGPECLCENQTYDLVMVNNGYSQVSTYNWTIPWYWTVISSTNNTIQFNTGLNTEGSIDVSVTNPCGNEEGIASTYLLPGFYCGGGYSLSPNPASDAVTININPSTTTSASKLTTTAANKQKETDSYSVKVIDSYSSIVYTAIKKNKQFTIPTATWSNGVYTIIVSDGIKSYQRKLVVKH